MDKVIDEVKAVKSTIRQFIELIRDIFNADVCYLYLTNFSMDEDEKRVYFDGRIEEIKQSYFLKNNEMPDELKNYKVNDAKILKFIDIAEKSEEKKWNYDYRNRPRKYVIFEKYDVNKNIFGEGLTAYVARTKKNVIVNNNKEIDDHECTAHLNTKFDIHPICSMMIGLPLVDANGNVIGVLKIENYGMNEKYNYTEESSEVVDALKYLPLLARLIKSSKIYFKKNSYKELFGGIDLLENLKKIKHSEDHSEDINAKIYEDTLHLFFVLKRKEYIGYEEIMDRITGYANDISKHLDLTEEIISYDKFLEQFKKHEELLLYGLNDYRDHFMHQFHVFVCGYIIINELGIEKFNSIIQTNTRFALKSKGQNDANFQTDVLRIWFLTAFYHDYAYILEKIDAELSGFFKTILGYSFGVKFNWEQLLKKKSNFPKHLSDLVNLFDSEKGTNQGTLLKNYLGSIIECQDHGVLSALLLIEYNSGAREPRFLECLNAALAISLHNKTVYEDLTENSKKMISFESFPIAFLLAFCDTAQSFGRLEKKGAIESFEYPVKFSEIKVENKKVTFKLEYISKERKKIPTSELIEKWAKGIHDVFKSEEYSFEIKYFKENELIRTLSFH